jgi:uncharacterized protein
MKIIIFLLFFPFVLSANSAGKQVADAICDGKLSEVQRLIRGGFGIDQPLRDNSQNTALTLASYCYGGNPEIAAWLLSQGADVNMHSKDDYSNLMWALRSTRSSNSAMHKVVWDMVKKGATINYTDKTTGRTPLMLAASRGDKELVEYMLKNGAVKTQKTKGTWCISGQNIQCTAADLARLGGHVEVALFLEGKDPDSYKQTLHFLVQSGTIAQVQAKINSGADVNEAETLSKLTPLHYAIKRGDQSILEALLAAKANPSPVDYAGVTPLRDAIVFYKSNLAKILIEGGARGDTAQLQGCGGGLTEFGWALEYNVYDMAHLLIDKDRIDLQGGWFVFRSLAGKNKKDIDILKKLLEKGAIPPSDYIDTLKSWHTRYSFPASLDLAKIVENWNNKPNPNVVMPPPPPPPPLPDSNLALGRSQKKRVEKRTRSMNKATTASIQKGLIFFNEKDQLSPSSFPEP